MRLIVCPADDGLFVQNHCGRVAPLILMANSKNSGIGSHI